MNIKISTDDNVARLDATEASIILGVSVSTVRRWHKEGKLVPILIRKNGHRLYSKVQLDEYKARMAPKIVHMELRLENKG